MFRHPHRLVGVRFPTGRLCRTTLMLVLVGLCCVFPTTTSAQSGAFLESLFRSIAEKQLEKQLQPSQDFPAVSPQRGSPVRASQPMQPFNPVGVRDRSGPPGTVDLRGFETELRQFQDEFASLLRAVQDEARMSNDPAVVYELRQLLPELYRMDAETKALVTRTRTAKSFDELIDAYRQLDQRYQEISFRLRSLPSRDVQLRQRVSLCDQRCRNLSRIGSIEPQFDRHGLHDQMVIAATYMQALIDDLPTARMPLEQSRDFVHQARLLRQAILEKADFAEDISYEEIVEDFTLFVQRWQGFADSVAQVGDPMLDRRLARIAQCGDETYAILWMPPPPRRQPITSIDRGRGRHGRDDFRLGGRQELLREQWMSDAAALELAAEYLNADLLRLARYLQPASYSQTLLTQSDRVLQLARAIHNQLDAGEPLSRLQRTATELATLWESFSSELKHLDHHGLTDQRALAILRQRDQMLPVVASLTASLLPVQ